MNSRAPLGGRYALPSDAQCATEICFLMCWQRLGDCRSSFFLNAYYIDIKWTYGYYCESNVWIYDYVMILNSFNMRSWIKGTIVGAI